MSLAETVVRILAEITDTDEVRADPDLPLYELAVLDSLRTVELMIALSEALGVEISPAEFDRDQWATPQRIIADMERRLRA